MLRQCINTCVFSRHLRSLQSVALVRANTTLTPSQEWDTAKPFNNIPGPKPLPIIGNAWRFIPGIGDFAHGDLEKFTEDFHAQYGNISRFGGVPGRKDLIFLFDPADIEKVFRNESSWPVRPGLQSFTYYREVTRKDFFKDAGDLLTTQGKDWGKFRTTVNKPMMEPRAAKQYVGPIDIVAEDFLKRMEMLRDAKGELPENFLNELYKWALESIALIALDARLGCLADTLPADSDQMKMIDSVQVFFETMYILNFKLPFWKLVSTPTWKRYVASADSLRETGMKYVNKALERLKSIPEDSDHELSILERILARDPNPKVACVMALDMMMAGIDTTSNAAAFLLYFLAVNPDKQRILQDEIDKVIPPSNVRITAEHLNDMKYLRACIKESMRISPVTQINIRTLPIDMVLQGYKIPKETDVLMCHKIMSQLEAHYSNPKQFIPERWLKNEDEGKIKRHPFVTMPFGFGARMCIGRRFAEMEIEVLVTKILQKYNVEWHHEPLISKSELINTCQSPLRYRLVERLTK